MVNPEVDNYVTPKERSPGIKEAILLETLIQERAQKIPTDDIDQRDRAIQVMATLVRARNEIQTLTRKPPSLGQEIGKQLRQEIRRSPYGRGSCGSGSCGVKNPREPKPRLTGHNA